MGGKGDYPFGDHRESSGTLSEARGIEKALPQKSVYLLLGDLCDFVVQLILQEKVTTTEAQRHREKRSGSELKTHPPRLAR
jgi:hypothetical protein